MSLTDEAPTMKPTRGRDSSGRDLEFEATIGSRIRAARIAAGMNQRVFGAAVGISYQKLQKYELGKDRIAVSTLQRIARALDLHPGEFFDDPMPKATDVTLDVKVAQRSIELIQSVPDPSVARHLSALVEELAGTDTQRKAKVLAPRATRVEQAHPRGGSVRPMRAVVDPLLKMLRQAGTGDAGALARLLGQALAEAEKIVKGSAEP